MKSMTLDYRGEKLSISYRYREAGDELVLFLHGLGCAKESFTAAFEEERLSAGFSLLAFDFPGHGLSDALPGNAGDHLSAYAEITGEMISAFHPKAVHLVGHSMGGAVGLLTARLRDDVVSFVSIEGNLLAEDCGLVSRTTADMAPEEFSRRGYRRFLIDLFSSGSDDLRAWADWYSKCDPWTLHSCARSLVKWSDGGQLPELLRSVHATAYIHGSITGLPEHLAPIMKDVQVRTVRNAGHFSMVDNTDGFYDALESVLEPEVLGTRG